jgi:hypothetical protein
MTTYGTCLKHPNFPMLNCPMCQIENFEIGNNDMDTTIQEGNKLIAEFMGIKTKNYDDTRAVTRWQFGNSMLFENDLQYHTSWDWLIPVCQKINSKESIKRCESNGIKDSIICYINAMRAMKQGVIKFNIDATWSGVVQFIQWYNQNNQ